MEKITSIDKLRKEFGPLQNVNVVHRKNLSKMEKLALFVTAKIGTMAFCL